VTSIVGRHLWLVRCWQLDLSQARYLHFAVNKATFSTVHWFFLQLRQEFQPESDFRGICKMARFPAEIQYSYLQYLYSVLNVKCFISIVLLLYRCGHATRYDWSKWGPWVKFWERPYSFCRTKDLSVMGSESVSNGGAKSALPAPSSCGKRLAAFSPWLGCFSAIERARQRRSRCRYCWLSRMLARLPQPQRRSTQLLSMTLR